MSLFTPVSGSGKNVPLFKEATRSVNSLAVVTRLTKDHEDVAKDVVKANFF